MRSLVRGSSPSLPVSAVLLAVAAVTSMAGCAPEAILSTDHLPVRRVVVYRNGVAYFERGGKVDGSEVRFKMKQAEVGDFLATLAVMEKGGSSVRAAAFPLDRDTPEAGDAPAASESHGTPHEQTPQEEADAADRKKGLRTVVLSLDGKEHDLQVGYVAESPVWRPSYRLVVHPDGNADLQAWGIVQNLSGEDWKDVHLTLVAGAPLAFQTDLGTSVIPTRPTVTDEGEVVSAVPHGETSLEQQPAPAAAPPPPPPEAVAKLLDGVSDEDSDRKDEAKKEAYGSGKGRGRRAMKTAVSAPRPSSAPAGGAGREAPMMVAPVRPASPPASVVPSGPRDLRSLAAIAAQGGSTKYVLPTTVTIPDKSATMVMLVSRPVPGEALFLYAPDGGVMDSGSHPFRVARFSNNSGGVLERGPIAVFEDGSFLGQGLVDPLPDGATATVPFALERSIAVDIDRKWDELGERVAKIENGELTVERDSVRQTKYRVRNGGDKVAKVLVKHPRDPSARLFSPPKDTEDNVGTASALIPMKVAPKSTADIVVDERTPARRLVDWFTPLADAAEKNLLADARLDAGLRGKLTAAWKIRAEIVEKSDSLSKAEASEGALLTSAEETRRNLRAIEKNRVADALRATLTQRLTETSLKIDVLTKQKVELESKLAELRVRFKEAVRDVKYLAPVARDP
jgi:hypothetical protein